MTAHPIEHYQQVADVYLEAEGCREPPDQAVAETWNVKHSTAARWVKRARELGVLGPVEYRCTGKCNKHCQLEAAPYSSARLLSPEQLADYLSVPLGTVYQWRTRRTGPPSRKIGKHVRYRQSDVERWLNANGPSE